MNQIIAKTVQMGDKVEIGYNVIIMDNVKVGNNCRIGNNVIIYEGTQIGESCRIDDNTIIGKKPMFSPRSIFKEAASLTPATIGDFTQIGANVIIYAQCVIGERNLIADMATIRENVSIGDFNIIGRGAAIENFCHLGNKNKIETNVYITAYSTIEDYCFIAPCVATSNDNYAGRDKERFNHFKGVTVKTGARIAVHSTILPGKTINEDAFVGAGSLVTKDIPSEELWIGRPATHLHSTPEKQLLKNNKD